MEKGQLTSEQDAHPPLATGEIQPQSTPICATETRFCLPQNIRLHLDCPKSEDDFRFTNANDRRMGYFSCNGHDFSGCFSLDQGKHRFLKDNYGATIIYMKRKIWACKPQCNIFAGATEEKHICKLLGHPAFMKLIMSTEFSDVCSDGIERQLWLKCDLTTQCNFYLGNPKHDGVLLARMLPQNDEFWRAIEFTVEIAANVDIALIAMLGIAVEQHCRDQRKALLKERR